MNTETTSPPTVKDLLNVIEPLIASRTDGGVAAVTRNLLQVAALRFGDIPSWLKGTYELTTIDPDTIAEFLVATKDSQYHYQPISDIKFANKYPHLIKIALNQSSSLITPQKPHFFNPDIETLFKEKYFGQKEWARWVYKEIINNTGMFSEASYVFLDYAEGKYDPVGPDQEVGYSRSAAYDLEHYLERCIENEKITVPDNFTVNSLKKRIIEVLTSDKIPSDIKNDLDQIIANYTDDKWQRLGISHDIYKEWVKKTHSPIEITYYGLPTVGDDYYNKQFSIVQGPEQVKKALQKMSNPSYENIDLDRVPYGVVQMLRAIERNMTLEAAGHYSFSTGNINGYLKGFDRALAVAAQFANDLKDPERGPEIRKILNIPTTEEAEEFRRDIREIWGIPNEEQAAEFFGDQNQRN